MARDGWMEVVVCVGSAMGVTSPRGTWGEGGGGGGVIYFFF